MGEHMYLAEKLFTSLKDGYKRILKNNLVGIYIHGSFVLDSFNESVSDLDYLVVVYQPLSLITKKRIMQYTVESLWPLAPAKGLEFHIVLLKNTVTFNEPIPFELHFSKQHYQNYINNPTEYVKTMHGLDPDLTAHFMITVRAGQVLTGMPIRKVFCSIPSLSYWNSILYDVSDAKSTIIEQPMYKVLNLCRALAYKKEKLITSKLSGGRWGIINIPQEYSEIIKSALHEYTSCVSRQYEKKYSNASLIEFADYMLNKIND
ncbi:nucleotidyltransferase [Liquorilactobacillus mali]|uniref:Nucleotidyltransferase n=2 Tax=Liquorilactobacillus mali TaxID=1618 RepID=A0A0R2FRK0_9LACO|nr:nucleotidyltransferase [Liquorilactobacillus mali]